MKHRRTLMAGGLNLWLSALLTGGASASAPSVEHELERRLANIEARLDELDHRAKARWLDHARADEIRDLVEAIIADADARTSLLNDATSGGYENGFFVASSDNSF